MEAGLKGVADAASASEAGAKESAAQAAQAAPSAAAEAPAGPLSDLLAELELGEEEPLSKGDAETHYNLGIAFREMGLLDEAISEFQKVVQNVAKNAPEVPPNFLQSCHLLALCFMEKEMPRIAVKWYQRALDIPELESETILALYYDFGLAYEQGSDIPAAWKVSRRSTARISTTVTLPRGSSHCKRRAPSFCPRATATLTFLYLEKVETDPHPALYTPPL